MIGKDTEEGRVFKNSVLFYGVDNKNYIMITDELGKEHHICYGILNDQSTHSRYI
jgi:hypothetical protein